MAGVSLGFTLLSPSLRPLARVVHNGVSSAFRLRRAPPLVTQRSFTSRDVGQRSFQLKVPQPHLFPFGRTPSRSYSKDPEKPSAEALDQALEDEPATKKAPTSRGGKKAAPKGVTPTATREQKRASIQMALNQLKKDRGGIETVNWLNEQVEEPVEALTTGSLKLDMALGVGGLPRGRITEIFGPESCGKTTLALHVIAEAQKRGEHCVFLDVENAYVVDYGRSLGIRDNALVMERPDTAELAMDSFLKMVNSGGAGVIVLDSVAALAPKAEVEGGMEDMQVGVTARLMNKLLRKVTQAVRNTNTVAIFINQLRATISTGFSFGPKETTPGGRGLSYHASVRLRVDKVKDLGTKENPEGIQIRVKVVKNKVAAPSQIVMLELEPTRGLVKEGELVDLGEKEGLLLRKGAGWYYEKGSDKPLGQGRDNIKALLRKDAELHERLEAELRKIILTRIEEQKAAYRLQEPEALLHSDESDDESGDESGDEAEEEDEARH